MWDRRRDGKLGYKVVVYEFDAVPPPPPRPRYVVERWNEITFAWIFSGDFHDKSQAEKRARKVAKAYHTKARVIDTQPGVRDV